MPKSALITEHLLRQKDNIEYLCYSHKVVLTTTSSNKVDITKLQVGIYFVNVIGESQNLLLKQKLIVY